MKHRALGDLPHLDGSSVRSLDDLERAVRRRPLHIGVLSDEEVVLLEDDVANEVDTPRLATYPPESQDAALAATMALLYARDELDWDGDRVELRGAHAAVAAMRDDVSARVQLRVLPDGSGGAHAVVDRIGTRDLAMSRVIEQAPGVQVIIAGTPEDALVWTLRALLVLPDQDRRGHPRRPVVQRSDQATDLDPTLLELEEDADVVVAVLATMDPTRTGAMTITSGPSGVHLHRGFATTTGEEHTLTQMAPLDLAATLATLLDVDGE